MRTLIKYGIISLTFVRSNRNLADPFTKSKKFNETDFKYVRFKTQSLNQPMIATLPNTIQNIAFRFKESKQVINKKMFKYLKSA